MSLSRVRRSHALLRYGALGGIVGFVGYEQHNLREKERQGRENLRLLVRCYGTTTYQSGDRARGERPTCQGILFREEAPGDLPQSGQRQPVHRRREAFDHKFAATQGRARVKQPKPATPHFKGFYFENFGLTTWTVQGTQNSLPVDDYNAQLSGPGPAWKRVNGEPEQRPFPERTVAQSTAMVARQLSPEVSVAQVGQQLAHIMKLLVSHAVVLVQGFLHNCARLFRNVFDPNKRHEAWQLACTFLARFCSITAKYASMFSSSAVEYAAKFVGLLQNYVRWLMSKGSG